MTSGPPLVAGVDVGGTNIRMEVLGGRPDRCLGARHVECPQSMAGIVAAITGMLGDLEADLPAPPAAVGVGCAGLVNRSGVVTTSPNIPAISDFPLRDLLSKGLDRPVVVDNDATAALRGEMEGGAAAGAGDALLVAFGTGIGAALLLDGRIRRGAEGLAGEAGHMIVAPDGPDCPCGRRGCWERLASGEALGRAARDAARGRRAPALADRVEGRIGELRGEHVGELAAAGDPVALGLLREFCDRVAVGLNNLILVLSPEVVVVGGGMSELGEVFLTPLREALTGISPERRRRPTVALRQACHGDRAGVIGAAFLALDELAPRV